MSDIITGAEFFAALRLVIHVEGGKEIDRSLAFVQGAFHRVYCLIKELTRNP